MIAYNLFLDDFRLPADAFPYTKDTDYLQLKWITVKNYIQFKYTIAKYFIEDGSFPALISFDHDLADEHYYPLDTSKMHQEHKGETETDFRMLDYFYDTAFEERTGYCAAKWLVNFCMEHRLPLPAFKVHSQNPAGAENIRALLNNYKKHEKGLCGF